MLAGAGVRRAGITGSGVFKDETSDTRMRQVFFDGEVETYQIVVPDFGRIEGPFQITSLEYRGDHAGEVTFEMAFESRRRADVHGVCEDPWPTRRGEVALVLGGKRYTLCLTLGALAELEDAFGVADLAALAERFAGGRLSAPRPPDAPGGGAARRRACDQRQGGGGLPLDGGIEAVAGGARRLPRAAFGSAPANPPEPQAP